MKRYRIRCYPDNYDQHPRSRDRLESDSVPPAANVRQLLFEVYGYGGWLSNSYSLSKGQINALKGIGVNIVADLRGVSLESIVALPGFGHISASRLVEVAQLADIPIIGGGWPSEASVLIDPSIVKIALFATDNNDVQAQALVSKTLTRLITKSNVIEELEGVAKQARMEKADKLAAEARKLKKEAEEFSLSEITTSRKKAS